MWYNVSKNKAIPGPKVRFWARKDTVAAMIKKGFAMAETGERCPLVTSKAIQWIKNHIVVTDEAAYVDGKPWIGKTR